MRRRVRSAYRRRARGTIRITPALSQRMDDADDLPDVADFVERSARHWDRLELAHGRLQPHQAQENPPGDFAIGRSELRPPPPRRRRASRCRPRGIPPSTVVGGARRGSVRPRRGLGVERRFPVVDQPLRNAAIGRVVEDDSGGGAAGEKLEYSRPHGVDGLFLLGGAEETPYAGPSWLRAYRTAASRPRLTSREASPTRACRGRGDGREVAAAFEQHVVHLDESVAGDDPERVEVSLELGLVVGWPRPPPATRYICF